MTKTNIIVQEVEPNSIADEIGIKKGDRIISVNGLEPKDIIDYSYIVNDEEINLLIEHSNGELEEYEIEKDFDDDLGITFSSAVFDCLKRCQNRCIFCFVDQQPKGLRKSLYVKDDDWRLSYIQGTYVTLTNFKEEDWQRIEQFHISPLFVSIHTTNPELRVKMTRNKNAGNILEQLKRFKKIKTQIHAQIVLCPEVNDGKELKRTLDDLANFKSIIKSIAIVPVGISKFREKGELKKVDKKVATETIEIIEEFNLKVKKQIAMASDEFFLLAGKEIPDKKYYGNFLQIEDGVGAIRLLKDSFKKALKKLKKKIKNPTTLTIATAKSPAKLFKEFKKEIKVEGLDFEVVEIENKFFGSDINVAGLIVGEDIINTIKDKNIEHLVIPSVMLKKNGENYSDEFLDGKKIKDIEKINKNIKIHILNDCYCFDEILDIINNL
ncbi:MAG: DUF512 domain-containing protein [Candidatus Gastranaerophilales bacterium]|nr:DUF512 domain-containing protein [Candidatus Gastranaerophilales bacterium]